jgi:hypothetical protein
MAYLHYQIKKLMVYNTDGRLRLSNILAKMPFVPLLLLDESGYLPIHMQALMPVQFIQLDLDS